MMGLIFPTSKRQTFDLKASNIMMWNQKYLGLHSEEKGSFLVLHVVLGAFCFSKVGLCPAAFAKECSPTCSLDRKDVDLHLCGYIMSHLYS